MYVVCLSMSINTSDIIRLSLLLTLIRSTSPLILLLEAAVCSCHAKELFWKLSQNSQDYIYQGRIFDDVAGSSNFTVIFYQLF